MDAAGLVGTAMKNESVSEEAVGWSRGKPCERFAA